MHNMSMTYTFVEVRRNPPAFANWPFHGGNTGSIPVGRARLSTPVSPSCTSASRPELTARRPKMNAPRRRLPRATAFKKAARLRLHDRRPVVERHRDSRRVVAGRVGQRATRPALGAAEAF